MSTATAGTDGNTSGNTNGKAKNKSRIAGAQEEVELAIQALRIDKISKNLGGTLAAYILETDNQAEFKKAIGSNDVTFEEGYITYKNIKFEIDSNGTIKGYTEVNGSTTPAPQLAENSVQSLAQSGKIQRWDKINYNPGNGTTANLTLPAGASIEGKRLASLNLPVGTTLEGIISASDSADWVVLDVDRTSGEVKIMPKTVSETKLVLNGNANGWNNAIEALDMVAGIYLNPAYASNSRSIRVEDINKVEGYTENGEVVTRTFDNLRSELDDDLTWIDTGTPGTRTISSTSETGFYEYAVEEGSPFRELGNFWLANRTLNFHDWDTNLEMSIRIYGSMLHTYGEGVTATFINYMCDDALVGNAGDVANKVIPIITLSSDVQLSRTTRMETATETIIEDGVEVGVPKEVEVFDSWIME